MKNLLLKLLLLLLFAFFAYIAYMLFITSGDTKNDEKICSQYIAPLNKYKNNHSSYPTLQEAQKLNLNLELSLADCGYRTNDTRSDFYFYLSEGLSVAGYESKNSKWWHD